MTNLATNPPLVLPVALRVEGRSCVVVGAGPVGERKARDLLAAGASVRVVAPNATATLQELAESDSRVTWIAREFVEDDLEGVRLVITATGVLDVDQRVFEEAERRHLWVNSADDPARCSFYLTALVRRDPVVVSITTAGSSPALAAYLRRRLDQVLENELGELALVLRSVRDELHDDGIATEHLPWSSVVDDELVALAAAGEWSTLRERVVAAVRVGL